MHKVQVHIICQDLTQKDAFKKVSAQIKKLKPTIDIFINNAGIGKYGAFDKITQEEELKMIELNVVALTQFSRWAVQEFAQQGHGYLLNVASMAGMLPGPLMAVYYATKAYVLSFTEALYEEYKDKGIHVAALCPGATESEFQARAGQQNSGLVKNKKLMSAARVAQVAYEDLFRRKVVIVPGIKNKILAASIRFFPRKWVRSFSMQLNREK
ncbi:SDR family NAD(P)-dependent oxidoreductase [Candidatus Peregrinibacteria bacterium]|nr:MAG: SDR family NAD(P)-dependent oxidoreductase [Candidatus Peregrinibacteria bacterium]